MSKLIEKCTNLKEASHTLETVSNNTKNTALKLVIESLRKNLSYILSENKKDLEIAKERGMKDSFIDRLILDENRVEDIIDGINTVINFDDPIWASNHVWTLENGLTVSKMNVPLGVIGIIYESRPNVTVDAFALSLKSGNCILLRGSSSAINSNKALVKVIKEGLVESEISENVIELIEDTDRSIINQMIKLNKYIDVIIPRGGSDLIRTVVDNATVPTIETGIGNCHIFVDESGKLEDAINIIKNAKVQRPGVCNACETILVHEAIAEKFLPILEEHLSDKVELRGCLETKRLIHVEETVKDWGEEYLD